ncbi:MAG: hypothetical protein KAJ55_01570 [Anaerolineales bacterium]|nr:hypothetical protein [Anaerolineales bacterium]
MVFMKAFSMGKKLFGGGGKKKAAPAAAPAAKAAAADKLKGESARATKELLSPAKSSTRKPIRMRPGARKAMSRGSSRSGGR